ncbi:MAG: PAS domain S-box protein [Azonexaceae bacterium]|nr:PAS domain S-box protein [Azonexaceae bacterium]
MPQADAILVLTCVAVLAFGARIAWRLRQERSRFRAIFDSAPVGMAQSSAQQRWIEVNPALARMLGYPREQLIGRAWNELTHPDDRRVNQALFDAVLRGERDEYTLEKRFWRADGNILLVSLTARAVRKPGGDVDYLAVVIQDITQQTQTEKQFARQVDRSALLLELPHQGEHIDEKGLMQYALERAEHLTDSRIGFMHLIDDDARDIELVAWSRNTLEKYCQASAASHYPLAEAGIWANAVREQRPIVVNDYPHEPTAHGLPEGHSPLSRLLCVPVLDNGVVRMVAGLGNKDDDYNGYDVETLQLIANETWRIVRRQRADNALRLAMQVVNASPVVCFRWLAGNGWPVAFVSDNVRQWGYTPAQLLAGAPGFASIVHPDDLQRIADEVLQQTAEGKDEVEREYRLLTAENRVIWVVDRTKITRDGLGLPMYFDGVLTDISDRKKQQLQLADTLDEQRQLNRRLEEANNQLLQSEKMASIGQLAAGIAHELNNPIGFVHSNLGTLDSYLHDLMALIDAYQAAVDAQGEAFSQRTSLAQMREERDFEFVRDDIFKLLAESKDGLSRVGKIVQDLKTFSRVGEQEWQEADLHQGIDSTLNIVWNELKYKCRIVKEYGDLPAVFCLISQLNQVFMNLLVNAGHAIEDKGTITIRTRRLDGERVSIEISDTGSGIARENLRRIFEPFFTTKPVGKGTGLGLSVSYSIVQRHHGRIEVDSEPGRGTTFRVILPIHPPPDAAQESAS